MWQKIYLRLKAGYSSSKTEYCLQKGQSRLFSCQCLMQFLQTSLWQHSILNISFGIKISKHIPHSENKKRKINGILFQNCSDLQWEKCVPVIEKPFLRSPEPFLQTVKSQNNFCIIENEYFLSKLANTDWIHRIK